MGFSFMEFHYIILLAETFMAWNQLDPPIGKRCPG